MRSLAGKLVVDGFKERGESVFDDGVVERFWEGDVEVDADEVADAWLAHRLIGSIGEEAFVSAGNSESVVSPRPGGGEFGFGAEQGVDVIGCVAGNEEFEIFFQRNADGLSGGGVVEREAFSFRLGDELNGGWLAVLFNIPSVACHGAECPGIAPGGAPVTVGVPVGEHVAHGFVNSGVVREDF